MQVSLDEFPLEQAFFDSWQVGYVPPLTFLLGHSLASRIPLIVLSDLYYFISSRIHLLHAHVYEGDEIPSSEEVVMLLVVINKRERKKCKTENQKKKYEPETVFKFISSNSSCERCLGVGGKWNVIFELFSRNQNQNQTFRLLRLNKQLNKHKKEVPLKEKIVWLLIL